VESVTADNPEPQTLTVPEAFRSVGKRVSVRGHIAIIVKVKGTAILVRFCHGRGHYQTVAIEALTRRPDCDNDPDPQWLVDARNSRKPSLEMHDLLHPLYSSAALAPDDVVDELTYKSYRQQRKLCPEKPAERWVPIFGDVTEMEERYQAEQAATYDKSFDEALANHLLPNGMGARR
jgi:hypothetical protein